jgi:hypothetical protein
MPLTNGSLQSLTDLDQAFGWDNPGSLVDLRNIVNELRGLRVSLIKGGTQSTLVKVRALGGISSGTADDITRSDVVLAPVEFVWKTASGIYGISLRGDIKVCLNTPGYVRMSAGATTGNFILLFWWDKDGFITQ